MSKIDVGGMVNQGVNTLFAWLNKTIGAGGSPLKDTKESGAKLGDVGGILGINIKWSTVAIVGAFAVFLVILAKKVK